MNVYYDCLTDRGDRELNEDSFSAELDERSQFLFTVADGLGGCNSGEVASTTCTRTFSSSFRKYEMSGKGAEFLKACFLQSQRNIIRLQKNSSRVNGMKTTCVALCCDGERMIWGHIGDSRLYAFKLGRIVTRTSDHSVPQMLVNAGQIKEKDIRSHASRNKILRALGDDWEQEEFEIGASHDPEEFDAFLLCSDGFWEPVTEKQMEKTLKKSASPNEWLSSMVEIIQADTTRKNKDNYTAIAVMIK